jgi:hypothetical protein
MKVTVTKRLQAGTYFVSFNFSDFTPEELAKIKSFGAPIVQVRAGSEPGHQVFNVPINAVNSNFNAGFLTEEQAKTYENAVLNQAKTGMEKLRQRKDDFSDVNEVEI